MLTLEEVLPITPVFSKLTPAQIKHLKEKVYIKNYKKGEIITFSGMVWPNVLIIGKGVINANKESTEGRSLTVRTFSQGDAFWGHALFGNYPTPTSLVSHKASTVYQWKGSEIMPFILDNNEALWELCIQLNHRMIEASKTIEDMAFNPVVNRLARLLQEQFNSEQQSQIQRNMTLDEMASKIGTTREVVCRLLYRFSDRNLIQVDRNRFILIDRIELNKLANGELVLTKDRWDIKKD